MRRGEEAVVAIGSLFISFLIMNLFSFYFFNIALLPLSITGNAVENGFASYAEA